jgi:glutamine---fructose-6-phosphate transaminase (isomerizing)
MNGERFEAEIREQRAVLVRLAHSPAAGELRAAIGDREPVFIGSGSSFFVAQLGALAFRHAGRRANAFAASEVRLQTPAVREACVIAISQSGRTADVLAALDALEPAHTIALTNDIGSPLAARATVAFDVEAGRECAVPASKSVTAIAALVLWAAALDRAGDVARELCEAASVIGAWLDGVAPAEADAIARVLEPAQSIVVIGTGLGVPVASEIALKIKEAAYRHAEGFGAGEFRHGSTAILDSARGLIAILDAFPAQTTAEVVDLARAAGALSAVLGTATHDASAFGPNVTGLFAPLGWIVAGQMLALALARRAGIDSDAPRGLRKYLD